MDIVRERSEMGALNPVTLKLSWRGAPKSPGPGPAPSGIGPPPVPVNDKTSAERDTGTRAVAVSTAIGPQFFTGTLK
jgi:hypothetical protein